jgi:hypothetical protein
LEGVPGVKEGGGNPFNKHNGNPSGPTGNRFGHGERGIISTQPIKISDLVIARELYKK